MSTEAAVLALEALLEQQKLSGVTELYSVKFVDIRRALVSIRDEQSAPFVKASQETKPAPGERLMAPGDTGYPEMGTQPAGGAALSVQSKGGDDIERTGADPKGSQGIRGAAATARGASDDNAHCDECGMQLLFPNEYHPYGACLMFRGCPDGATVRSNIAAIRDNGWPAVSDDGQPDQQWHEIAKEPIPKDVRFLSGFYLGDKWHWGDFKSMEDTHWAYAPSWLTEGPK